MEFSDTSIGNHTISIFKKFPTRSYTEDLLHKLGSVKGIKIHKTAYNPNYYDVEYVGKDKGVSWLIRFDEFEYKDKDGNKKEHKQYYIEAKINPKIIVGETEYIVAANETYIEPMIKAYNSIVENISDKIPLFEHCAFKEIHYCINFQLKDLDYPYTTGQVMKLFKCGYIPPKYEELKYRCEKSHHLKSLDYSFYLISRSVVVNCYDKQGELIKKQEQYPQHDYSSRIKDAEGIIRFEIQCKYSKIYNMIKDIKNYCELNYEPPHFISFLDAVKILLSDAMAKKVLYNYYLRILGFGDYYSLSNAKEKVLENCCSPKAERLIATLEFINDSRGIHKAKAKLDADVEVAKKSGNMDAFVITTMKEAGFCNSLRELNALNINPVTIPRNDKIPYMPNPFKEYLDRNGLSKKEMEAGVVQWPNPTFHPTIGI